MRVSAAFRATVARVLTPIALSAVACTSPGQTQVPPRAVPAPPTASAAPRAPRAEIDALLSSDGGLDDEAAWTRIGPPGLATLEAVARDDAAPLQRRARAIAAMACVHNEAAAGVLRGMAFAPEDGGGFDSALRAEAVIALARRVGRSGVAEIQPLLGDGDAQVRAAAARALGLVGGADAQSALEARIEEEPSPEVRERIQQSLTRMQP